MSQIEPEGVDAAQTDHQHYDRAPIVEAVIEVSVERTKPIAVAELAHVVHEDSAFKKRKDLVTATGKMTVGPSVSASATTSHVGFQYLRDDEKVVLHVRVDGFAVSRLAPYTDWEDLYQTFRRYWEIYSDVIMPDAVTQLGVRYVNRFDLPGRLVELSDYFRTYPEVSTDIEFPVNGFMTHLQIGQPDLEAMANVVLAAQPPAKDDHLSILLDIGLTKQVRISGDNETIHRFMSELRDRKNRLFEACIKPVARELIRGDNS